MSDAALVFSALVWVSTLAALLIFVWLRAPKRRKAVDELEAVDAALRNRIVDLEDKFETYTKREAVRYMRARKDASTQEELPLPLNKEQRKADLVRRWNAQRGMSHGTVS